MRFYPIADQNVILKDHNGTLIWQHCKLLYLISGFYCTLRLNLKKTLKNSLPFSTSATGTRPWRTSSQSRLEQLSAASAPSTASSPTAASASTTSRCDQLHIRCDQVTLGVTRLHVGVTRWALVCLIYSYLSAQTDPDGTFNEICGCAALSDAPGELCVNFAPGTQVGFTIRVEWLEWLE